MFVQRPGQKQIVIGNPGVQVISAAVFADSIYTNASPASIAPTVGSERVVNGTFAAWTADNPNNWSITGEVGTDPEVSEVGTGELHGGAGSGLANLFSSATNSRPLVQQSGVFTVNLWYVITALIDTYGSGSWRPGDNIFGAYTSFTGTGTKMVTHRPAGTSFRFQLNDPPGDLTIDNVSVKQLTNFLDDEHNHATPLSFNQCALTITDDTQSGVYQRHASSGDYVLAYISRSNDRAYLIKVVGGTTTEITSAAITYAAGKVLKLKHHQADGWQVFYDTPVNIDSASALITSTSVTDANLDACDEDGLFSTDSSNSFADYKWSPN